MNDNLMEKIKSGRQYRTLTLNIVEEESKKDSYIVRGYATTFNEPYVLCKADEYEIREQVSANAFDECDMTDVIMQFDHEGRVFARIRNNTLRLFVDEHGLLIEADLSGTEEGRKLYEEIKGGYIDRMSFGFVVSEDNVSESKEGKKTVYLRTITKIGKLYDVSAVSFPANDGTEISARSFVDGVIAKVEAERLLEAEKEKRRIAKERLELEIMLMEV